MSRADDYLHAAEVLRELARREQVAEIQSVIHTTMESIDEWSYAAMMAAVAQAEEVLVR